MSSNSNVFRETTNGECARRSNIALVEDRSNYAAGQLQGEQ